jgi:hypothetical protein
VKILLVADCWEYFGNSLFVLGEIGGNDYAYMLFFGWSIEQAMAYVPQVITVISSAMEVSNSFLFLMFI